MKGEDFPQHTSFSLTVAESKRLIAKGVANMEIVKRAQEKGTIAVARGTTNAYLVEELLNKKIEKIAYTAGLTLPRKREISRRPSLPDVVLKKGRLVEGLPVTEAVKEMKRGDVFIKGANALDYNHKVAGILIGHPTGGTIGATWGTIIAQGIHLVIPVGLEKLVCTDIDEMSRKLSSARPDSDVPMFMPVTGIIVTEIEALRILTQVKAYQISAGGIGGAEGSVRLLIEGTKAQLRQTLKLIDSIQGEPPFLPL